MKTIAPLMLGILVVTCIACDDTAAGAATDSEEAAQAVQNAADRAGSEVDAEIEQFREASREQLRAIDAQLDTLERRAEAAGKDAKAATDRQLAELRADKKELEQRLDRAAANSKEDWQQAKRDMAERLAELGRSTHQAPDTAGDEIQEATD